jgi:hypothetical protein
MVEMAEELTAKYSKHAKWVAEGLRHFLTVRDRWTTIADRLRHVHDTSRQIRDGLRHIGDRSFFVEVFGIEGEVGFGGGKAVELVKGRASTGRKWARGIWTERWG